MTEIYPPYTYEFGDNNTDHDGDEDSCYELWATSRKDRLTGIISCGNYLVVGCPGDYFLCTTQARSGVQIEYLMEATGRLNITAHILCVASSFSGSLYDEWGWSSATIDQQSIFFMVLGLGPDYDSWVHLPLLDYHRGGDEGQWSGDLAQRGEWYTCNFSSRSTYSNGQPVILQAGISDYQRVRVNDMSTRCEILNDWVIGRVTIDVIP